MDYTEDQNDNKKIHKRETITKKTYTSSTDLGPKKIPYGQDSDTDKQIAQKIPISRAFVFPSTCFAKVNESIPTVRCPQAHSRRVAVWLQSSKPCLQPSDMDAFTL